MRRYRISGSWASRNDSAVEGRCERQADPEERIDDGHVVDLRVPAIPVLDLQPLREVTDDPRVEERLTGGIEAGFVVEGTHEDLEPFAERVVPEVVEPGLRYRSRHQVLVCSHPVPPYWLPPLAPPVGR